MIAQPARIFEQSICFETFNRGQPRGARDWIFFVRVMAQRALRHHIQILASQQGGQRENSAPETFPQHQHVRRDIVMLACEHFARAAQAVGDLV